VKNVVKKNGVKQKKELNTGKNRVSYAMASPFARAAVKKK